MTDQVSTLEQLSADQQRTIRDRMLAESSNPLTVAIMGQTGVGKSSLLNALFGATLRVGEVRPTTKEPEPITMPGSTGHPLTFWDMPGIGESENADSSYLMMYRQKLTESDVVLWAIHADSRSTLLDARALNAILADAPRSDRRALIGRITFVLTKADLLTPPPWIYFRDGEAGTFVPSKTILRRITEKAKYYQEALVSPYGGLNSSETYQSDGFKIDDPRFQYDEFHVRYSGFMSEDICAEYSTKYPKFAPVFGRLCDNHRVIPCSALFRYNLLPLMIAIVNKLGEDAIGRFQRLVDGSAVSTAVPVSTMRKFCNLIVWDIQKAKKTFDLDDTEF